MLIAIEDRLAAIMESEPLELDGKAYKGKYELNDAKSIRDFMLCNLRKKTKNMDTGKEIIVSKQSALKISRHYKDSEPHQKIIACIPQIIENMKFLEEMPGEKSKFDNYSYYITEVNIDGNSLTVLSVVGYSGNEIYYDHTIFDGIKRYTFERAREESKKLEIHRDAKYSRLAKILENINEGDWNQIGIRVPESPTAFCE